MSLFQVSKSRLLEYVLREEVAVIQPAISAFLSNDIDLSTVQVMSCECDR